MTCLVLAQVFLSTWPMVRGAVPWHGAPGAPAALSRGGCNALSSLPPQGTTVRMITAIDQDKGRPRGIGYTIVSGKSRRGCGGELSRDGGVSPAISLCTSRAWEIIFGQVSP